MELAVVTFDDGSAVAHKNWLTIEKDNIGKCYWPPFKSPSRLKGAVISGLNPTPTWNTYPCVIKKYFATYEAAHDWLRDYGNGTVASDGSGTESIQSSQKRMPTIPERYRQENMTDLPPPKRISLAQTPRSSVPSIASSSGNMDIQGWPDLPAFPAPDLFISTADVPNGFTTAPDDLNFGFDQDFETHDLITLSTVKTILRKDNFSQTDDTVYSSEFRFREYVVNQLISMNKRIQELTKSNVSVAANQETLVEEMILLPLPLYSQSSVVEFDGELLNDSACRRNLVLEFIALGGSTCQDAVDRMLKKFMTDETVAKFSWKGRSGKLNFSSLRVNDCIFESLRRNPKTKGAATEEISQQETQKYIHRVNDRIAKRLKENQNNQLGNTSDGSGH